MEKTQENTEKCTFCMIFQKIFFKLLCCLNYIYNFANRKTQVILQGNEV